MKLDFLEVLQEAQIEYLIKKEQYGESWKSMEFWQLEKRLEEEFKEYQQADNQLMEYHELIDVINVACMLAERLRKEYRLKKEVNKNE